MLLPYIKLTVLFLEAFVPLDLSVAVVEVGGLDATSLCKLVELAFSLREEVG